MSAVLFNRLSESERNDFIPFVRDEIRKSKVVSLEYLIWIHFKENGDTRTRERFADMLRATNEFIATEKTVHFGKDFDISFDHSFKPKGFSERYPIVNKGIGYVLSAVIAISVSVIADKCNKSAIQEQVLLLQRQIDTINQHNTKTVPDTIKPILKKDSSPH